MKGALKKDEMIVQDNAEVTFTGMRPDGHDWTGTLRFADDEEAGLAEDEIYELQLEDGRSGTILIREVTSGSNSTTVKFEASGRPA